MCGFTSIKRKARYLQDGKSKRYRCQEIAGQRGILFVGVWGISPNPGIMFFIPSIPMKKVLFLALFLLSYPLLSQAPSPVGTYFLQMGSEDSRLIEYELNLHPDGSFNFHSFTKSSDKIGLPSEENQYGQGTWVYEDKKVLFLTRPETDLDAEYTLDLGGSRAHFLFKSPRTL